MPTAVDRLTKSSSSKEASKAVSACISQMTDEHPDWSHDRRVTACYNMAREKTGKTQLLSPKE